MIELQGLNYGYRGQSLLFRNLNCRFQPGNIYGLLGRNGAGKTTLLKCIAGMLLTDADQSRVDSRPTRVRDPLMLQVMYYLPEEFHTPDMRISEYVKAYSGFYPRFSEDAMERHLREFDLDPEGKLTGFSYGMKKKFLLAFGLATGAAVLLLDEPTNGLDIPSKSQFRKVLAGSLGEKQIIIVSTHQVRDMKNLIDPVVILEGGRILLNAEMDEISAKLRVSTGLHDKPDAADLLYAEEVFGSYTTVERRRDKGDGETIDTELLFNAVIQNPDYFLNEFGRKE